MLDFEKMSYEEHLAAFSRQLVCHPWREEPIEWEEPVSAYAEPNIEDAWQAREGWY